MFSFINYILHIFCVYVLLEDVDVLCNKLLVREQLGPNNRVPNIFQKYIPSVNWCYWAVLLRTRIPSAWPKIGDLCVCVCVLYCWYCFFFLYTPIIKEYIFSIFWLSFFLLLIDRFVFCVFDVFIIDSVSDSLLDTSQTQISGKPIKWLLTICIPKFVNRLWYSFAWWFCLCLDFICVACCLLCGLEDWEGTR